jgi:phosphate transport system permease protein
MNSVAETYGTGAGPAPSAAAARLAKRYSAERRFKAYGIVALGVTAFFLLFVLTDIFIKAIPAFTESRLSLKLVADQAALDPKNTRDPKDLMGGEYDKLIRTALGAQFPDVTSRAAKKLLNGLLSSGAADDFRRMVVNDPSLIGKELTVPVLLSDDADQYYKGLQTRMRQAAGGGTLSIVPGADALEIKSTAADFLKAFDVVKNALGERIERRKREIARLEASLAGLEGEAAAALQSQIDALKSEAQILKTRVDAASGSIDLDERMPSLLVRVDGGTIKAQRISADGITGTPLVPATWSATTAPGSWSLQTFDTAEADRRVSDQEIAWLEQLRSSGLATRALNTRFLTSGDSREPELAGIRGAFVGSVLTLAVTLLLCLPIGVAAAIYLEEFAPKNRLTEIIEININNLAAVPSIVFGLLGLAMFLNFFGLPRSAPLVGGLVLALLVLPTIIIASRAALKAVPPSIKEAALGVGASHQQAILHHVLPLAVPGIMTGTIIGMAHALGETAPLLMIGMVAFIVDIPTGVTDSATALPVQIYLWSDLPEVAFQAKTAAAIVILLAVLFAMNAAAIYFRKRFERRW